MAKFNISGLGSGLLNEVTKLAADQRNFNIVEIPLNDIQPNKKNNYSTEDIGELIYSIEHNGIRQPLEVYRNGDKYTLISGERRYRALCELNKKYPQIWHSAPCKITDYIVECDLPLSDETKELYALTITNSEARKYTDADLLAEISNLRIVYNELKANGYPLTGRQRDLIASDLQISARQVQRFDYVLKNASEDVKSAVKDNALPIAVAEEVSKLPKQQQDNLLNHSEDISKLTAEDVKNYKNKHKADLERKKVENTQKTYPVNLYNELNEIIEEITSLQSLTKPETIVLSAKEYKELTMAKKAVKKIIDTFEMIVK